MRRNVLVGCCLAVTLGAAGCQDQSTEPSAPAEGNTGQSTALARIRLERGRIRLPRSVRMTHQVDVARVIDEDDYVCDPNTPVIKWFLREVDKFIAKEPATFDLLYNEFLADLIPTYDALLFETNANRQYFGYKGEYTKILTKTHKDVKAFWNIFSRDIQLIGMHGTMLLDVPRSAQTYAFLFGLPNSVAADIATIVRNALRKSKVLDQGNHPLFSFNAFAFTTFGGDIPDKIVMGDGILAGYKAVGFDDVAPQAVYAHEFGHHIQFENGYFDEPIPGAEDPDDAEFTRYTELMADAYSAYYLTNKRGAGMKKKRVKEFLQVFFQIGDCAFDNPGHHGTPNQRMAAAQFGFDVADQSSVKKQVLTSQQFHALFVLEYPALVAPDA